MFYSSPETIDFVEERLPEILDSIFGNLDGESPFFLEAIVHRERNISDVHKGFFRAQELIKSYLISIQNDYLQNRRIDDREHRKQRRIILEFREAILRKLSDSIVWILFDGEYYLIRRLFIGASQIPINPKEIENVASVLDLIKGSPLKFALISDLTSCVQIGDLILVSWILGKKVISIVEVKTGETNRALTELIDSIPNPLESVEFPEPKLQGQFERIIKQNSRKERVIRILDNKYSPEPPGENSFKLITPEQAFETKTFTNKILRLLKKSKTENWAIDIIDGCLYTGVYSTRKGPMYKGFDFWTDEIIPDYPSIDFRDGLYWELSMPLFLHPFSLEEIQGILTRKYIILFRLDFDTLFKIAEHFGIRMAGRPENVRQNLMVKRNQQENILL